MTTAADTPYPEQQPPDTAPPQRLYDCAIVGGGPAGLSAAIYVARYNRSAVVIDAGEGRSTTHEHNENYLGFPDGIAQRELRRLGQRQAARFGAEFLAATVHAAHARGAAFVLRHDGNGGTGELRARTVILATGVVDEFPDIPDIEDYVGRCVFWCITCDGYKSRGKHVVVVGDTDEASATCLQFAAFTDRLTLATNVARGKARLSEKQRARLQRAGVRLIEGRVSGVEGDGKQIRRLCCDGGGSTELDMIFSQLGSHPNTALAGQLGVTLDNGYVKTDHEQRTSVERVFAAGDVTRVFAHQVVTAAHEGATAAITANYELYPDWMKE